MRTFNEFLNITTLLSTINFSLLIDRSEEFAGFTSYFNYSSK
jgi:hypothetical protein